MAGWIAVLLAVFAAVAMQVTSAHTGDEDIAVSCYKGDPEEGNYIGNVTVFKPENAGRSCNILFYECEGRCSGCYSDFDFTEDICYDSAGRKFLK